MKKRNIIIAVVVVLVLLVGMVSCGGSDSESTVESTEATEEITEEESTEVEETTEEESTVEETMEDDPEANSEIDAKREYLLAIDGAYDVGVDYWDDESIEIIYDIMYTYIEEACGGIENIDIEESRLYLYDSEYGFYSESEAVGMTDFEVIRSIATLEDDYWAMWESGEFETDDSASIPELDADNFNEWYRSASVGDYASFAVHVFVTYTENNLVYCEIKSYTGSSDILLYLQLDSVDKIKSGDELYITGYYNGNTSDNNLPCFYVTAYNWTN